jgi:hypothetical protein
MAVQSAISFAGSRLSEIFTQWSPALSLFKEEIAEISRFFNLARGLLL